MVVTHDALMANIKRQKTDAYRAQRRGGREHHRPQGTREEDFVENGCSSPPRTTHILFFTNAGRVVPH